MLLRRGSKSAARDRSEDAVAPTAITSPLAVEIYYYGVAEPTTIPLPGAEPAAADAYFRRLRADVIDAQRHSEPRLRITPFRRAQGALSVVPLEIQRLILVDRHVAGEYDRKAQQERA